MHITQFLSFFFSFLPGETYIPTYVRSAVRGVGFIMRISVAYWVLPAAARAARAGARFDL